MKKLLRGRFAITLYTYFVCIMATLPLFNTDSCNAMEIEDKSQLNKFFNRCPTMQNVTQINIGNFHAFLAELPLKLTTDQDENIIHNFTFPKNEDTQMPFCKEVAAYYNNEYYWFSFFSCKNCDEWDLSNFLSTEFSVCQSDEQQFVEPKFQRTKNDTHIKTYTFNLLLTSNSEIIYCHLFYLDRSEGRKDSNIPFEIVSESRKKSIQEFYKSILTQSDNLKISPREDQESSPRIEVSPSEINHTSTNNSPIVRAQSSPVAIPSSKVTLYDSDDGLSISESPRPNKTLPRKGSSSPRNIIRKLSNTPKRILNSSKKDSNQSALPNELIPQLDYAPSTIPNVSSLILQIGPNEQAFSSPRSPKGTMPSISDGSETGSSQESPKALKLLPENFQKEKASLQNKKKEEKK